MLTRAPAQADHLEAEAADGGPAAALGRGTLRAGHLHRHPQVRCICYFNILHTTIYSPHSWTIFVNNGIFLLGKPSL